MKSIFESFSKAKFFLLAAIASTSPLLSPLEANLELGPSGDRVIYEEVSWQPMRLTSDHGDCTFQMPGEPITGVESPFCFAESVYNDCDYFTIMSEQFYEMPQNAAEAISMFESDFLENEGFLPENFKAIVLDIQNSQLSYGVQISFEEEGEIFCQRVYCSKNGFVYSQIIAGNPETALWHFFDTLEILK